MNGIYLLFLFQWENNKNSRIQSKFMTWGGLSLFSDGTSPKIFTSARHHSQDLELITSVRTTANTLQLQNLPLYFYLCTFTLPLTLNTTQRETWSHLDIGDVLGEPPMSCVGPSNVIINNITTTLFHHNHQQKNNRTTTSSTSPPHYLALWDINAWAESGVEGTTQKRET